MKANMRILLLFCVSAICPGCLLVSAKLFSAYQCSGPPWPVDTNRSTFYAFQRWIDTVQHDCSRPVRHERAPVNGMGSSFLYTVKNLATAIESNAVYRPLGPWLWASKGPDEECSLGLSTVDCFFQPLSTCAHNGRGKHFLSHLAKHANASAIIESPYDDLTNDHNATVEIPATNRDTCGIGSIIKKSLTWIQGSYFHYLLRPAPIIAHAIQARLDDVYNHKHSNTSVIGAHVRGGRPDGGRKPANLSYYMSIIDETAQRLAEQQRPVSVVFLCSDLQEENIISSDHMSRLFPRPWTYVVLPHQSLGSGEAEYNLRNDTVMKEKKPSMSTLVMEYVADLKILAAADYFLGSLSNVYLVVASLRAAYHQGGQNDTCWLDIADSGETPPLHCGVTPRTLSIIRGYNNGGFTGGTPFNYEPII